MRPILAPEGVVFIDSIDRMLLISQTRSVRGSWQVGELSLLANHLLTGPQELVYVDGLGRRSERYVLARNQDGSVVCMSYRRGAEQAGMSVWQAYGGREWSGFAVWKGRLFEGSKEGAQWSLSEASFDALMDGERVYNAPIPALAGEEVQVRRGDTVLATGIVDEAGVVMIQNGDYPIPVLPNQAYRIGYDFDVLGELRPPISDRIGFERRRITRVWVDVYESGAYRVDGALVTGMRSTDSIEAEPRKMTGSSEAFYFTGYDSENTVRIEQRRGEGAPLLVRAVTIEVSY